MHSKLFSCWAEEKERGFLQVQQRGLKENRSKKIFENSTVRQPDCSSGASSTALLSFSLFPSFFLSVVVISRFSNVAMHMDRYCYAAHPFWFSFNKSHQCNIGPPAECSKLVNLAAEKMSQVESQCVHTERHLLRSIFCLFLPLSGVRPFKGQDWFVCSLVRPKGIIPHGPRSTTPTSHTSWLFACAAAHQRLYKTAAYHVFSIIKYLQNLCSSNDQLTSFQRFHWVP